MHISLARRTKKAIPLHAVKADGLKRWLPARGKREAEWLHETGFCAKQYELALVPKAGGGMASAVLGLGGGGDPLALAALSESLPSGVMRSGISRRRSAARAARSRGLSEPINSAAICKSSRARHRTRAAGWRRWR